MFLLLLTAPLRYFVRLDQRRLLFFASAPREESLAVLNKEVREGDLKNAAWHSHGRSLSLKPTAIHPLYR